MSETSLNALLAWFYLIFSTTLGESSDVIPILQMKKWSHGEEKSGQVHVAKLRVFCAYKNLLTSLRGAGACCRHSPVAQGHTLQVGDGATLPQS